jgi:hypothetical protein
LLRFCGQGTAEAAAERSDLFSLPSLLMTNEKKWLFPFDVSANGPS